MTRSSHPGRKWSSGVARRLDSARPGAMAQEWDTAEGKAVRCCDQPTPRRATEAASVKRGRQRLARGDGARARRPRRGIAGARRRNELERATRRARPSLGRDPLEQPRARAPVALGGRPIRRPAPSRRARVGDDRGAAAGRRAPARARGTSSEAIARVARRSPRRRSHRGAARRLARRARASLAEADRQASLGHSGSPTGRAVLRSLSHHRGPAALPHSPS
jgi:hypothetical protein